jgi:hypothetical protein
LCKSYGFLKLKCNQENKVFSPSANLLWRLNPGEVLELGLWACCLQTLIWQLSFRGKLHRMIHCGNLTQGTRKVTYIVEIFLRSVTLSRTSIHKIQFWTIFFFCIISSVLEQQINSSCWNKYKY